MSSKATLTCAVHTDVPDGCASTFCFDVSQSLSTLVTYPKSLDRGVVHTNSPSCFSNDKNRDTSSQEIDVDELSHIGLDHYANGS